MADRRIERQRGKYQNLNIFRTKKYCSKYSFINKILQTHHLNLVSWIFIGKYGHGDIIPNCNTKLKCISMIWHNLLRIRKRRIPQSDSRSTKYADTNEP